MRAKGGGQEWYYHAPSSNVKSSKQPVPPASQIPGLSVLDEMDLEAMRRETGTNKRGLGVDSKYITLAKQGGRKDLLSFKPKSKLNQEPKAYPRVDWFDHGPMSEDEEKRILAERRWNPPDYMVHEAYYDVTPEPEPIKYELGEARREGRNIQEKYGQRGTPFHTENQSVWKKGKDGEAVEVKVLPEIKKKAAPRRDVEFGKLIGGEYGGDWLKYRSQEQKKSMKKWVEENKIKGNLTHNLTEYQESIAKRELPKKKLRPIAFPQRSLVKTEVKKEPFKMKKFSNVPSKLATNGVRT